MSEPRLGANGVARPAAVAMLCVICSACLADDHHSTLEFQVEDNRIIASGEIDGDALTDFMDIIDTTPAIETLVLQNIGGSVDDDANLEFGRQVRDLGIATLVPSDGLVASGGTDLFLAGTRRTLEPGACVGVHAWAADEFTAIDLPRDDPLHAPYLEYYADLGINPEFYWFTLDAAPAESMHWITVGEAARFAISTETASALGTPHVCDAR